jgi:hypothetical protein
MTAGGYPAKNYLRKRVFYLRKLSRQAGKKFFEGINFARISSRKATCEKNLLIFCKLH